MTYTILEFTSIISLESTDNSQIGNEPTDRSDHLFLNLFLQMFASHILHLL